MASAHGTCITYRYGIFSFCEKTGTFKVAIKAAYDNCLGNTSLQVNFVALIISRICVNECACVYLFVCMLLSID